MTAEEFMAYGDRPENQNRFLELVRGEVIELPPPNRRQSFLTAQVSFVLGTHCEAMRRCYVTMGDCGVILARSPDTVRGPDVAVYDDASRWEDLPQGWGEVAPVLAVEITAPGDPIPRQKVPDYLDAGTRAVWLVGPETKTILVFRPGLAVHGYGEDGVMAEDDALPGLTFAVGDLFRLPSGRPSP